MKKVLIYCTLAILLTAIPLNVSSESTDPATIQKDTVQPQQIQSTDPLEAEASKTEPPKAEAPKAEPVDPNSRESIFKLVNLVEVDAVANINADVYKDLTSWKYITTIAEGTKVKLLRDKGQKFAQIRLKNGTAGWMKYEALTISDTEYTVKKDLAKTQKSLFVNYKEYSSETPYLIWINLERQRVNVFLGSKGHWGLAKTIICSSGTNLTPTINGEFKYQRTQSRIRFDEFYVRNFMRFFDSFAIHSIPYKYDGTPYDSTLGTPSSHGCIRVSDDDLHWLAYYIPKKTTIIVF